MRITRRTFLRTTGAGAAAVGIGWARPARAQKKQAVTIAFPETVTTLDPQPAPRNSVRESMYEAVFDRYLQQDRQLRYHGHVVEAWQWSGPDKMAMDLKIRQDVKFHDGSDLTAEDVAFSMERMKKESIDINSVGFLHNMKGPFRVWESEEMISLIDPVFEEKDDAKRIAAAKKAARHVIEHGYMIPLFQVVQPIVLKKELNYQPFPTGVLVPQEMSWA